MEIMRNVFKYNNCNDEPFTLVTLLLLSPVIYSEHAHRFRSQKKSKTVFLKPDIHNQCDKCKKKQLLNSHRPGIVLGTDDTVPGVPVGVDETYVVRVGVPPMNSFPTPGITPDVTPKKLPDPTPTVPVPPTTVPKFPIPIPDEVIPDGVNPLPTN